MPDFASLLVKLQGDASSLDKAFKASQRQLEDFSTKMTAAGSRLTAAFTLPIAGVGLAALKTAGQMEQTSVAFKTMLGSADAAQKHLADLKKFALETPFEFNDLTTASKRMQALGFEAAQVLPTLRVIGDAAAGLGMGAEGINRITLALGQMKAKGVVSAEEMRQLAEAGIPAWQILAKTLGTDVAGAMKLVEQRAVSSATAVPALLAGMNAKFGGLMAAQSQTLLGQWSNFKDKMTFALTEIGTALMPVAKDMIAFMTQLGEKAKFAAEGFAAMPGPIRNTAVAIGGLVAVAGPLLIFFGQIAASVKSLREVGAVLAGLRGALPGLGGIAGAVGIGAIAGQALWDTASKTKTYTDFLKRNTEAQKENSAAVAQRIGLVNNERAAMVMSALAVSTKADVEQKATEIKAQNTQQTRLATFAEATLMEIRERGSAAAKKAVDMIADLKTAGEAWGQKLAYVTAAVKDNSLSIDVMRDAAEAAVESVRKLIEPSETLTMVMGMLAPQVMTADQAFEALGLKSQRVLDAANQKLRQAYDTLVQLYYLRDPGVKAEDINRAADVVRNSKGQSPTTSPAQTIGAARRPLLQVSTIVTDLSRGLTDVIFKAKSLGQVFSEVGKQIAQSIVRSVIEKGINAAIGALGGLMSKLGGLGKTIGGIFGGGSAGGGAGSVGNIGGAVGSSIAGAFGSIAGAVSGIISNFQLMGLSKDTGRMEESLRGLLNVVALNGAESIHHFAKQSMYATVGLRDYWQGTGHALLVKLSSNLDVITQRSAVAGGITINITGGTFGADASSMDKWADELARRIRERAGVK